ncbi:MAG: hypothetical protein ACJ74Q_15630 [Pyrinomonadaceae bacterium]
MTIILDVTNPEANRVENYNDGETLLVTPNLYEAIDDAAITAETHEAVVRVRVGGLLDQVEFTTSPRALRFKTRLLQLVAFLLHHMIGMPGLAGTVRRVSSTGSFEPTLTPSRRADTSRVVATPLDIEGSAATTDYITILDAVRNRLLGRGYVLIDHLLSPNCPNDGVLDTIVFSDNTAACFYDYGEGPEEPALRALREADPGRLWETAVMLAHRIERVPGDVAANAILFWRHRPSPDGSGHGAVA